jgi:hypothetical protein
MVYVLCTGGFAVAILALIGLSEAHAGVSRLFRELEHERATSDTKIDMGMNRAA